MVRKLTLLAALLGALPLPAGAAAGPGMAIRDALTLAEQGALYAHGLSLPPPPPGQDPEARARWVLEELRVGGRTPPDWVRWSQSAISLQAQELGPAGSQAVDLAAAVLALSAVVGVPPSPGALAEIVRRAAALPPAVRAPFARLVAEVTAAYAAQAPLARVVGQRWARGFDPARPPLAAEEREATARRAADLVAALNRFRAVAGPALASLPATGGPAFADPEGLVVLGSNGDDTYRREGVFPDPVLLVDPGGNDVYETSAGGACPATVTDPLGYFGGPWMTCNGLVLSITADLGEGASPSDDRYVYDGPPAPVQGGGGPGAIGILVDAGGDDRYEATMTRGSAPPFEPLTYYLDGGSQGFGYGGVGVLLDGSGNDRYSFTVRSTSGHSIWALGQGFGGAGGLGVASDLGGDDQWLSFGRGGSSNGFQGIYTDGVGFYGGVGILTDTGGGDDTYRAEVIDDTVDFYAQGFGAFGGLGVLYEDGGDDDYSTYEEGRFPWIDPLLNCAFGTASYFGVGVMAELGGNDRYYGGSFSPKGASVMDNGFGGPGIAYGAFVDLGGTDTYIMEASGSSTMIQGRGLYEPGLEEQRLGHNTWGTFVDLGGTDTYQGGPGENDSQWLFGVDRDL